MNSVNTADSNLGGTTEVGAYSGSTSFYGTFDQTGNVAEWTEALNSVHGFRCLRAPSWGDSVFFIRYCYRPDNRAQLAPFAGFRVASVPESGLLCDFNDDGLCNGIDIDQLMFDAETGGISTDLTGDGTVDNADRDQWLALAGTESGLANPLLVGDSNVDGTVDVNDLNALALSWQQGDVSDWTNGNFTVGGGTGVNIADLNELALNWKATVEAAATAVPEPTECAMLLVAFVSCIAPARRTGRIV